MIRLPRPSRRLIAAGAAATVLAAGSAFAAQRLWTRRWRATDEALAEAGLTMVDDLVHHDVATSDGGVIHAVELGQGPPIVLVHGVTLSDAVWVRQFTALADRHRVIAVDQRGHGPSVAGDDGYTFDRLAEDLLDVLDGLAVRHAVLVGHSMGGMVSLSAALAGPDRMAEHVAGLVLVGTTAGPVTGVPWWPVVTDRMTALTHRTLASAQQRGWGLFPGQDLSSWSTRMAFGSRPTPLDLELTRSLISAMSPSAMAELLVSLVGFDVRARLGEIRLPTRI
ncbi:MAG TPA: alpha/beta hydrolase, partial [Acidimicrobiales bacterium]|nr:alpha/beta hydrolase [Acidimicrobiales bacterium]